MSDAFLDFVSKVGAMKPATVDDTDEKQMDKLHKLLLSPDYDAEEKIDGCHYMTFGCRLFSTEGVEKTNNYPHLRDFFVHLQMPNLIIDGEINFPDKTSQYVTRVTGAAPDQACSFQESNGYVHYTIWDILRTPKGTWLINQPYRERRAILEQFYAQFIKGTSLESYIHLVDRRTNGKKEFFEELIAAGHEGVVLKKVDSIYIMGKKPKWQWMKLKQQDEADFFISGYEPPKAEYGGKNIADWPYWKDVDGEMKPVTKFYYMNWIGALELSAYVNGKPTVVCTCSGLTESMRESISKNKQAFLGRVCKVTFMEKTEAGYPRHPRFTQFHESKRAEECTWELATEV